MKIEKLSSSLIYEDAWLKLWVDRIRVNNVEREVSRIGRDHSVVIIPILSGGRTILLKHYRYPTRSYSYEFPMGGIDEGEEPEGAAKRELLEETGLECSSLDFLGKHFANPGLSDQEVIVFVAMVEGEVPRVPAMRSEGEQIEEAIFNDLDGVCEMVSKGEITDSFTLCALAHILVRRREFT